MQAQLKLMCTVPYLNNLGKLILNNMDGIRQEILVNKANLAEIITFMITFSDAGI